jgi:predicted nucleotidyltransferase
VNQLPLPADWVDLLRLLTSRKIKFAITGGVAFSVHARARYTADLDIVLLPDRENVIHFIDAFEEFGFSLKNRDPSQFLGERRLLRVGSEPSMIDVMNFFDGVELKAMFERLVEVHAFGFTLPFVSRDDLILNKLSVGRPRDIADVDELRKTAHKC